MKDAILLVDDSAFMRNTFKSILTRNGYENILEAGNGEEAYSLYREKEPGLVFLDIVMKGESGIDTLIKIRNYAPNAKVVICSSMSYSLITNEAKEHGAYDFIVKPFDSERVMGIVNVVMS